MICLYYADCTGAGSQLVLLVGEETVTQNAHESGKAVTGELALVPPFLGGSQRLLNADHHKVYFKVSSEWLP